MVQEILSENLEHKLGELSAETVRGKCGLGEKIIWGVCRRLFLY